jgi:GTP cyclohydrolase I
MQELIKRQLAYIGEDPGREGLVKTPARILKSWDTLYSGYKQDPADIFTVFESEGFDQMVLLRDIEMYSMCEHHMLPFFGKAHVAYLPGDKVVGISKLARLVDIYARRLQIQERLGEQITTALMEYLHPKGAACIIEAQHMCMRMRGVSKQNSIMITSSLKGAFLDDSTLRTEFMTLIR